MIMYHFTNIAHNDNVQFYQYWFWKIITYMILHVSAEDDYSNYMFQQRMRFFYSNFFLGGGFVYFNFSDNIVSL